MKELDIVYSDENSFRCDFDLTILIHGKQGWLRNETENCVINGRSKLASRGWGIGVGVVGSDLRWKYTFIYGSWVLLKLMNFGEAKFWRAGSLRDVFYLFLSPHPPMLPHLESSSIPNSSITLRNQDNTIKQVIEQYRPYHLGVFRRSAYRNVSYCNVSYPPFWTLLSLSSEATI